MVKNMYAEALTLVLNKVLTSMNTNFPKNLKDCLAIIAKATTTSIKKDLMLKFKILKVIKILSK